MRPLFWIYLMWLFLVVVALFWGFVTGLCFAGSPTLSWLDPAAALMGMAGVLGIGIALLVAGRR